MMGLIYYNKINGQTISYIHICSMRNCLYGCNLNLRSKISFFASCNYAMRNIVFIKTLANLFNKLNSMSNYKNFSFFLI